MPTARVHGVHQKTVRCADKIHVARLPLATAHLAISKTQLLLGVPMKGLGTRPAMAVHLQHAKYFPNHPVAHQRLARLGRMTVFPKQHDTHRVTHRANAHPLAEIPVAPLADTHGFLVAKGNLTGHLLQLVFPALKDYFSVQL